MFAKSQFISFISDSYLLCSFWFQVYSEILLAWTWKPRLPSVQHRRPWNPTWSPYYGRKTVHPLSKCVLWWHCHISLCSHICQNSDILKLWHLKSLRSKCFVQFWTSTAMEFRSLSNGQTLSSASWIRASTSTLLSLQPSVPPTSNVYLDLRRHIPTAEIKYWFLRRP